MVDSPSLLSTIPDPLRTDFWTEFSNVQRSYFESRWRYTAIDGGRFAELTFNIVDGLLSGEFPAQAQKPKNFVKACRELEQYQASETNRSLRITIPRALMVLYDIRSNRDSGHIGSEVIANQQDSQLIIDISAWITAELIRYCHRMDISDAETIISSIIEKRSPVVIDINGTRIALISGTLKERILVLLHTSMKSVNRSVLYKWLKKPNIKHYNDVLKKLDKSNLVYIDDERCVHILPNGTEQASNVIARERVVLNSNSNSN